MDNALIISLNFNPGHVSHLIASYKQFEDIGYRSVYFVNDRFVFYLPKGSNIAIHRKDKVNSAKIAVFLFPSQYNLTEIIKLKLRFKGCKVIYIFHEPMESLMIYHKSGFTARKLIKSITIDLINSLVVWLSDIILLPSNKALQLYSKRKYYLNKSCYYIPLMFDDESKDENLSQNRNYFSYIGTIAADHSFNEFFNFIEWAISNSKLIDLNFLIATKSQLTKNDRLKKMLSSGRLILIEGRPLTNYEINECYSLSYVVWNAYIRTTQSGVLAKSFMFGTPLIILKKNISEFTTDGHEVVTITDNRSFEQIENAVQTILSDFSNFSKNCRHRFLKTFYYKNYNQLIQKIISRPLKNV